ncbi:MAG: SCO family protein [Candidatus Zixiibacteriota bacterium]
MDVTKKWIKVLWVVLPFFLLATFIFTMSALRGLDANGTGGVQTAELADYGAVGDFTLTERSGESMSLSDLRGSIWVADFIFTHCAGPCPLMSLRMSYIQDSVGVDSQVRLVSFSVDPDRDTPERLREYADQYGARERWLFFTGPIETIKRLAVEGFQLSRPDEPVLHSTMFALVDQNGHVRAYYHSDDDELIPNLMRDIAILEKARPS